MKTKHLLLLLTLIIFGTNAQKINKLPEYKLSKNEIEAHIRFIASDEMLGRRTGEITNNVAARYVAENFRLQGLKTPNGQKDYLQAVPFEMVKPTKKGEILVGTDSLKWTKDFIVLSGKAAKLENVPVVFVGYGWVDEKQDDYKGLDVKGKIVIKEYPPKRVSLETIEAHIQQLENQNEFKPDLIIIDYLDLLKGKSRKERKDEIDDVYTDAKGLAKVLNKPIISPSQANRTASKSSIIEGDNAAGSYDKIMIGDIIISVARRKKDKVRGTGKWHIMKNRYGADGLTFNSTIDTANGKIIIDSAPTEDDDEEGEAPKVGFSNFDTDDRDILKKKFFELNQR